MSYAAYNTLDFSTQPKPQADEICNAYNDRLE